MAFIFQTKFKWQHSKIMYFFFKTEKRGQFIFFCNEMCLNKLIIITKRIECDVVAQWLKRWTAMLLVSDSNPAFAIEIFLHENEIKSGVYGGFQI